MYRALLVPLLLLLAACGTDSSDPSAMNANDPYADGSYADGSYTDGPYDDGFDERAQIDEPMASGQGQNGQGQRVVLMDRGLQMARGAQVIPSDWHLTQDIATDPNTGQIARYMVDLRGPQGQLMRGLGTANYGQIVGTSFQQAWQQAAMRGLQGEVGDVSMGNLQRSAVLENMQAFQKAVQMARQQGMQMEGLEAPFRGSAGGRPVQGIVYVTRWPYPQFPDTGLIQVSLILSPAELLPATIRLSEQMSNSYRPNPEFEQRVQQISQASMQRQSAESRQQMAHNQSLHQQRMANIQSQFETSQAIADQRQQTWQEGQDAISERNRRVGNAILGTVDIYDAQAGQTVHGIDNTSNTYWTDQNGNVVGTEGYENPDPWYYEQAPNLDDVYDQGGVVGDDGW